MSVSAPHAHEAKLLAAFMALTKGTSLTDIVRAVGCRGSQHPNTAYGMLTISQPRGRLFVVRLVVVFIYLCFYICFYFACCPLFIVGTSLILGKPDVFIQRSIPLGPTS